MKTRKLDSKLLLTIDIGNSMTSYRVFVSGISPHIGYVSRYDIPKIVKKICKSGVNSNNIKCIISSVVPKTTAELVKSLTRIVPRRSLYIVGKDVFPEIRMKYQRKLLGSDRLVNIYGAVKRYKLPILVVDFGTAITFDYVGKSGVFEGGLIVPGVEISFRALEEKTALLPKLEKIEDVRGLVGHNTKSAMWSGLLNGFGALADGLIGRFKQEYGSDLKVLATGGFARRIARYTRKLDYVDPLHTLRSLALIYKNEIEEKNR